MHSRSAMSFTEKRVSVNAFVAAILGILLNAVHIGMMVCSVIYKGNVPFYGGVVESYLFLFSVFGLLWAVLSLDDEKTNGKFKTLGIILNSLALMLSIMIMILGVMSY